MIPSPVREPSASESWDAQYRKGAYRNEPPVKFVETITRILGRTKGRGLYVGCGNGRNYIPLISRGLDLYGIDVSKTAIKQILDRIPHISDRLRCVDFADMPPELFDYLIAIQVFQHGSERRARGYFEKAHRIIRPGGLFFARVNSADTDIVLGHRIIEKNGSGGFTVLYEEGPKAGLAVHFYSRQELDEVCGGFEHVKGPQKVAARRAPPETGSWVQWELVMRRR